MSYILDALRRSQAERERERGQLPGLDAQPVVTEAVATPAQALPRWGLAAGVAAGVGVLLLALGAAWLWRGERGAPVQMAAAPDAAPPVATAPPPRAPLPVVVSAPPQVVTPAAQPTPARAATPASATAPAPVVAPPPAAAPVPAPVAVEPAKPAPRTPTLGELTPEQRRELPAMVVGGSIWSENKASRFVIFNGQVVREGEAAAPGVMLESIKPKAAVLRFRELRFELPL